MNLHFLPFFRDIGETDMAFDGIVISNVVRDMKEKLIDGRIYKIYQPEKDELNIVIKNNRENYRLLMAADASLPLIYFQQSAKENPMTAPNFCMLLRKHINNGRIVDVYQPGFERIVVMVIEHLDVDKVKDGYRIITVGVGDSLGMSLYGASVLAENGEKYDQILRYYYTGIEIAK